MFARKIFEIVLDKNFPGSYNSLDILQERIKASLYLGICRQGALFTTEVYVVGYKIVR